MTRRSTRRQVLGGILGASAAASTATGSRAQRPIDATVSRRRRAIDAGDGGSGDRSRKQAAIGDWPTFAYDAANTGHAPDESAAISQPQARWEVSVPIDSSPVVVDGSVYFTDDGGTVHALDTATGDRQWTTGPNVSTVDTPAVVSGTVYVRGRDRVYLLDAATGSVEVARTVLGMRSSPTVADGTVYFGGDDGVYAFDAATVQPEWTNSIGAETTAAPAVADGTVFVGTIAGGVYAIDADDGGRAWSTSTGGLVASAPAVADGTVFVGSLAGGGSVYAFDAATGSDQWRFETGGRVTSSPAVADGTVFVGNHDETVYALDAGSGSVEWTATTGGAHRSSPAVVDGLVVVGSDDGGVYAFDAATGERSWRFGTGAIVRTSPAVVDDTVFLGNNADQVYSIRQDPGAQTTTETTTMTTTTRTTTTTTTTDAAGDDPGLPVDPLVVGAGAGAVLLGGGALALAVLARRRGGDGEDGSDGGGDTGSTAGDADTDDGDDGATAGGADTDDGDGRGSTADAPGGGAPDAQADPARDGSTPDDPAEAAAAALDEAATLVEDCHPEGPAAAALSDARTHYEAGNYERARERARQATEIAEMEIDRLETARQSGAGVDEDLLAEIRAEATEYELAYAETETETGDTSPTEPGDPLSGTDPPASVPTAPDLSLSYGAIQRGERLGSGGTADVYRARVRTGAGDPLTIALKEPRFDGGYGADVDEEFEHEAETWENLDDHDNVVGVVDWGTDPHPWIAMEYMDGGPLTAVAGKLPVRQAVWTALCTVRGVYHAHEYGVAHLDLKPGNVLLGSTGPDTWPAPKVADWGLARLLLEYTGSVRGYTPLYAAPEQIDRDRFGTPGKHTDIYQLGAVCYALFTGRPPHTGEASKVVYDVLESPVTPPTELAPGLPARVDEILLTALEKEQADRYETIVYLRDDLQELYDAL